MISCSRPIKLLQKKQQQQKPSQKCTLFIAYTQVHLNHIFCAQLHKQPVMKPLWIDNINWIHAKHLILRNPINSCYAENVIISTKCHSVEMCCWCAILWSLDSKFPYFLLYNIVRFECNLYLVRSFLSN